MPSDGVRLAWEIPGFELCPYHPSRHWSRTSRGGFLDPDVFNLELRKFLKKFGVTSQREIETAVEAALARGTLRGTEVLPVRATLEIPGVLQSFVVDGEIALAEPPMPPAA